MNTDHLTKVARRPDAQQGRKPSPAQLEALAKRLDVKLPTSFETFATTYGRVWFGSGWGFDLYDHEGKRVTELVSLGYYGPLHREVFAFKALHVGHAEHGADIFLVVEAGPYHGRLFLYSSDAMEHGILEEPSEKVMALLEGIEAPLEQLELLLEDGVIEVTDYRDIDDLVSCIRYTGDQPFLMEEGAKGHRSMQTFEAWRRRYVNPAVDGPTLDQELRAAFDADREAYDREFRPQLQRLLEDRSQRTPRFEYPARPDWRPVAQSFWHESSGFAELEAAVERCPHHLQSLSFHGLGLSRATVAKLARSEALALVDQLDLADTKVKGNLAVLAHSGRLSRLLRLDVSSCAIDDEALAAFARGGLERLASLDLVDNRLTAAGVRALAEAPFASALQALDLSANDIGAEGAAILAELEWSVERLALSACDLDDDAVSTLVRSQGLRALADLELSGALGPAAAEAIATSPTLGSLFSLTLSSCPIGAAGARAIAATESLSSLRVLSLHGAGLGDAGAEALAAMKQELHALYLGNNRITADGVRALMASQALGSLQALGLRYNAIGDDGARAIAEGASGLTFLDVEGCELTPAGIASLVQSPLAKTLTEVALDRVKGEELTALARRNKAQALAGAAKANERVAKQPEVQPKKPAKTKKVPPEVQPKKPAKTKKVPPEVQPKRPAKTKKVPPEVQPKRPAKTKKVPPKVQPKKPAKAKKVPRRRT